MEGNVKLQTPDIIKAISKKEEEFALARPRTKKARNSEAREFGLRLEQIRKTRGLSQLELAERADLYQSDVSDFERGLRLPETRNLLTLCRVLRISMDQMLGLKDMKANGEMAASRGVVRRMRQIEELPRRDRQALLRMIDNTLVAATGNGRTYKF